MKSLIFYSAMVLVATTDTSSAIISCAAYRDNCMTCNKPVSCFCETTRKNITAPCSLSHKLHSTGYVEFYGSKGYLCPKRIDQKVIKLHKVGFFDMCPYCTAEFIGSTCVCSKNEEYLKTSMNCPRRGVQFNESSAEKDKSTASPATTNSCNASCVCDKEEDDSGKWANFESENHLTIFWAMFGTIICQFVTIVGFSVLLCFRSSKRMSISAVPGAARENFEVQGFGNNLFIAGQVTGLRESQIMYEEVGSCTAPAEKKEEAEEEVELRNFHATAGCEREIESIYQTQN